MKTEDCKQIVFCPPADCIGDNPMPQANIEHPLRTHSDNWQTIWYCKLHDIRYGFDRSRNFTDYPRRIFRGIKIGFAVAAAAS
jgi:hypothetical protein